MGYSAKKGGLKVNISTHLVLSFPWDVGIRENDLWSVKGEMEEGRGVVEGEVEEGRGVVEGEVEGGGGGG